MLVKFNHPSVLGFKDVLIKPGINDLTANFVAEMQDDVVLAGKFDSGKLEIIGKEDVGVKAGKKVKTGVDVLINASEKNAISMAAQTVDTGILAIWLKKESRPKVKVAIQKQLAKIRDVKFRTDEKKVIDEDDEE